MQHLVSAAEMQELDRRAIDGHRIPGRVLMEVAGRAVAEAVRARVAAPASVVVAAGTGNNGGDGFVAARALLATGYDVRIFIVGERDKLKPDARSALAPLEITAPDRLVVVKDTRGLWELSEYLGRAQLAVDALLGTGVTGEVRGPIAEAIAALNEATCPKLAVDLPSGIDADTGALLGRAVRADETVTFAFPKRGQFLFPGAEYTGKLTIVDIGIAPELALALPVMGRVLSPADGPSDCRVRPPNAHKGDFGHLLVLAGSEAFPGAAVLALSGALRSGVGRVSWATDAGAVLRAPPRPPEVMLRERRVDEASADFVKRVLSDVSAVVAGPGWGVNDASRSVLATLLSDALQPLCLDADALNLLASEPGLWATRQAAVVVTPHPKEMARLLGTTVEGVQRDRIAAALELAASRRVVVVLKGAHTIVADPKAPSR